MPVDYSKGKIYKICSLLGGKIYVGSTARKYLSQRMEGHRREYDYWKAGKRRNKTSSFDLFDEYGVENCQIELIESFPCASKDELHAREGQLIREMDCVNRCIPGLKTRENLKEYRQMEHIQAHRKKWLEDNKEVIAKQRKKYREANKEQLKKYREENKKAIAKQKKKWNEDNKEAIAKQRKKYREANKEVLAERRRQTADCPHCGKSYRKRNLKNHIKNMHTE